MSITDELREAINELRVECKADKDGYGVLWYPEPTRDRFSAIADRIDAEHESLLSDKEEELVLMDGSLDRLSGTIAELCSVLVVDVGTKRDEQIRSELVEAARNTIPLPKDADGETIHLGDELEFRNGDRTVRGTVQALSDCWVVFGEGPYYGVKSCHHVKPDSWEAIIEEAASYGDKRWFSGTQGDKAIIAELVERCKRLAGEE